MTTCSLGELRTTQDDALNVTWKIRYFLDLPGGCYTSPSFTFSNATWNLEIHLSDRSTAIVPIHLCRIQCASTEVVESEWGIMKSNGELFHRRKFIWKFTSKDDKARVLRKFLTKSDLLRKNGDLELRGLTIYCTLKKRFPKGLKTLSSDFENMLNSTKHSDVTIKVKSKEYKAHKSILAARSTVFDAMFDHDMSEKNSGVINIEDCNPESFKDFLSFLYTGIPNITAANVCDLYKTADKYCVEELKSQSAKFMSDNLSVDNVCEIATLADQYSDVILNLSVEVFFRAHSEHILFTSKWKLLSKTNLYVADKLLKLIIPKRR